MFHDFEFKDDGRMVHCTRGVRNAAAGHATDVAWWYLSLEGKVPVRLLRVYPGETREQVWESALRHLDRLELRPDRITMMAGLDAPG
jgi:hypothetical protein